MVAVAGSKGGFVGALNPADRSLVDRMLRGRLTFAELEQHLTERSRPSIGLVVNNSCNLSCSHCYLQVDQLLDPPLSTDEWRRFARSAMQAGVALLSVCGKEPLLGRRGMEVMQLLRQEREHCRADTRLGLITNGTLMDRHRDGLEAVQPDFLDVSLEGLHAQNDQIRGIGSFDRTLPNIEWAADSFGERFFLAMTIQRLNRRHLATSAEYFRQRGLRNLFLSFYQPQDCSDGLLALEPGHVEEVFDGLRWTRRLAAGRPLNVYVDLGYAAPEIMRAFAESRWFTLEGLEADATGMCFLRYRWPNGVTLYFRFSLFPLAFWHTARVTPEGLYLGAEDTLDASCYESAAAANIRDFDCDFSRLQAHALQTPVFRQGLEHFMTVTAPEWRRLVRNVRRRSVA